MRNMTRDRWEKEKMTANEKRNWFEGEKRVDSERSLHRIQVNDSENKKEFIKKPKN